SGYAANAIGPKKNRCNTRIGHYIPLFLTNHQTRIAIAKAMSRSDQFFFQSSNLMMPRPLPPLLPPLYVPLRGKDRGAGALNHRLAVLVPADPRALAKSLPSLRRPQ